jgi:hypothetical protein
MIDCRKLALTGAAGTPASEQRAVQLRDTSVHAALCAPHLLLCRRVLPVPVSASAVV